MKNGYIQNYKNYKILYYGGDFIATNEHGATVAQDKTIRGIKNKIKYYNNQFYLTYEQFTQKYNYFKFKKTKFNALNGVCYWLSEPLTIEQKRELKKYKNIVLMVGFAQYRPETFCDVVFIENKQTREYNKAKQAARDEAVEFERTASEQNLSYAELAEAGEHFEKLGRRFGLLREFRENGIC